MKATLLVSQKAFSLSKMKPICKWHQKEIDVKHLAMPNNFEERAVNAMLNNVNLANEFNELRFNYVDKYDIIQEAKHLVPCNEGLTDVVLFIDSMKIGKVVRTHVNPYTDDIFKADSADEAKIHIDEDMKAMSNANR